MSGTLSSIYDNVSFALSLHSEAMSRLQEQVATGNRVNRPSDSPSDAYRILGLDSQKSATQNYINNLSDMEGFLGASSTIIENIISEFVEARKQMTQITSGTYGEQSRQRVAEGINSILEQIVMLANTKQSNRYLFGGSNTTSAPYVAERTDGQISKVTYQGSAEQLNVEVAPGLTSSAFYVGDDIFRSTNRDAPIFFSHTGAKAGTGTSSITGDTWLLVTYDGTNYKLSIDDGASFVTVPVGGDTNQAVTNSRTGQVLYVDSTEINSTGADLVSVHGTYDVFNTLISIRDILENKKELSNDQLQELLGNSLESLQEVNELLVQTQVSVGSRIGFLGNLQDNLENIQYNSEDELTRLQQADIAQVAMDLSRREILYQMSLSVAAKLMSMSLLDFIE